MSSLGKNSGLPVLALEIDKAGRLMKKMQSLNREGQLENTLLAALYPNIRVATVDVPQEPLDGFEQALVEQALVRLEADGVKYSLVGATGSAKNGKYYAVDARFERPIAERFKMVPEAAVTYFGILVSPCQARIEIPDCRVLVVEDHELGTNDCRGWISRSLFRRLDLKDRRLYQFRLAFERTQAKGSFKVMEDAVADKLEADIILPESSIKPKYKGTPRLLRWLVGSAKAFRGFAVLGIRDVSRRLEFESSYTLVEHAPVDSISMEILPHALDQVRALTEAIEENNLEKLLDLLGSSDAQQVVRTEAHLEDSEYTSTENTILEALLKADGTGFVVKHPWVSSQLQRRLAHWAFKVCTAGGLRLPAFTLADDGFLICHNGEVYCGSDWLPKDSAFVDLTCEKFLCVRYPIRTKQDLLPLCTLSTAGVGALLRDCLHSAGCAMSEGELHEGVIERQLRLEGTLTLDSETAKRNGGDFDFDMVCVVEGNRFPRFVESRFSLAGEFTNEKNKYKKRESPWWNLPQVALSAKGNQIGSITDLKTSCLAAGRADLADQLAIELQAALDSLKWGTAPDQDLLADVRKKIQKAPWLELKNKERVSDLPLGLDVLPTDSIGQMYNVVRKRLDDFFTNTLPLENFRGLIAGGSFNRAMYDEARTVYRIYAANVRLVREKQNTYELALEKAQAEFEAGKHDPNLRKELLFRRNQAAAALRFYKRERARNELKAMIHFVAKWAQGKTENQEGWLQALYSLTCKGRGNGSVVFYAFPQLIVNKVVERTGGRPVKLEVPGLVDGDVRVYQDGRVFLVDQVTAADGRLVHRENFLLQITEKGELLIEVGHNGRVISTEHVRPFRIEPGESQLRDGRLVLPGTQQRPAIPVRTL